MYLIAILYNKLISESSRARENSKTFMWNTQMSQRYQDECHILYLRGSVMDLTDLVNSILTMNHKNIALHQWRVINKIFRIYIGSTQPRAVHPLPNAKDVYSPPYPLPCLCTSWSPSPGSSMIVAVFLFFSYRAVSTGKSSSANDYLPF